MNAAELMKRVIEYGADEKGIGDRFMGSDELYETCFMDLMGEENVELLRRSMLSKDYPRAFDAAHALKGLSGNLGLTAYYKAICVLVESLRAGNYENVDEQYAETERQFQVLVSLLSDAPAKEVKDSVKPEKARDDKAPEPPAPKRKKKSAKANVFVPITVLAALIVMVAVYLLFDELTNNYEINAEMEGAAHLVEINYQLGRYIEDRIETDWLITYTVGNAIAQSNFVDDDGGILNLMRTMKEEWKASDIALYTENGYCFDSDGNIEANDLASDRIYAARSRGKLMSVIDSDITYAVPVDTGLTFDGSGIVAVSVVKSMKSFLDDMGFSSFGDSAYMYLVNAEGIVISRLNNAAAKPVFNVMALFDGGYAESLTSPGVTSRDMLAVAEPTVFLLDGNYVVSTPVDTRQETLRLIYFAPETVVNRNTDSFSANVTVSSIIVILVFAAGALMVFLYVYGVRKKQFDSAIMAREHMFDLLVKKSRMAFGLFELNRGSPAYISVNAPSIVGIAKPTLVSDGEGYKIMAEGGRETPTINRINESMRGWSGKTDFRSGFLLNTEATPANYFDIQLYPISEDSDEYVGIAQDATLMYERETVTKNALEMAERANEAKTRFLSNMSHDIRTPMNAIVNMADFAMEDMNDPEKLSEHLKTIRESSDHLLLLINDILDMSRIESGKAVVERAPFDIKAELNRLRDIVKPLCAAKGQLLICDFDSVKTRMVLGDRLKVSQILMNLLSNAVKFTPQNGAVRFTAKEEPSIRENYADMRFIVEDTGMGISKEFIPRVFDPFTREDVKRVSGIQGTGLGLSICHSYVVAMGGIIKCESEEGEGSAFTVELFFEKTRDAPQPQTAQSAWDVTPFIGKRCLICEDNPTNQRIAKTVLERLGFRVEVASDGREGLTKFEKSADGYYDIIYMDIQMPVMDGYEAAAAIRGSRRTQAADIPIVAMTANVFIEDIEKARIAGMDGHVGKPITTSALIAETKAVFDRKRRTAL